MNKQFAFLLILVSLSARAEQGARDIVDKALHLDEGKSVEAQTRIQVVYAGGKIREKTMRLRRNTIGQIENTRIDFISPADVKGLALLIVEQKNGETDQHLYSPALRRIRRIRGSLKSQEFADTDFSYEDLERRNIDDADYSLDGEETVDGHPCFKITGVTKKKVRSQYGKTLSWIDKETFLLRKMELFDREGKQIKTLISKKSDKISGVVTQLLLEMENLEKMRKTLYEVQSIQYDVRLDNSLFTTFALSQ